MLRIPCFRKRGRPIVSNAPALSESSFTLARSRAVAAPRRIRTNGGHGPTSNATPPLRVKDLALGRPRKLLDAICCTAQRKGRQAPPLTLRPRQALHAPLSEDRAERSRVAAISSTAP